MLSGWFRKQRGEKVDILGLSRKSSTPGNTIPETVIQSQLQCMLSPQGDDTINPPVTSKSLNYKCYLFEGDKPEVSQIVKRDTGERLTILTKPEKIRGVIVFNCQHKS